MPILSPTSLIGLPKNINGEYKVLNPRGIRPGVQILQWSDEDGTEYFWYEGDLFEKPPGMQQASVDEWVKRGFLELLNSR